MPIMNTRTKMYFIASDRARRKNVFHTFFFICAIVFFCVFLADTLDIYNEAEI